MRVPTIRKRSRWAPTLRMRLLRGHLPLQLMALPALHRPGTKAETVQSWTIGRVQLAQPMVNRGMDTTIQGRARAGRRALIPIRTGTTMMPKIRK